MNGKKAKLRRRMMVNQPPVESRMNPGANKRKAMAIVRLRESGLFEMDMESWIEFFDENPDQATPGFVNFIISERRSQPICTVYTFG